MIGDILPSFQFHPFSLKICLRLPLDKATAILKLLVEGMSIRGIERVTQVHRDTILRLLLFSGAEGRDRQAGATGAAAETGRSLRQERGPHFETGGRFVAYWTWNRLVAGAVQFKTKPPGVSARLEKLMSGSGEAGAVPWTTRRNCGEPVMGTQ